CSLWSSPVLCPQSLVIPCTVCSLWSSPVLCPQSLFISCAVSAVSGHLLYCVRSLWPSPVLCLQSIGSEYLLSCFSPLKPRRVLWSGASCGAKKYGVFFF
ncbi:unnamed protein product, partial [Staurois parvus]